MREFTSIFGMGPGIEVRRIAMTATRHGYAVIPVQPLSKAPSCTLTRAQRKVAGKAHKCGVYHAITEPKIADRVFARLAKGLEGETMNLGIVAGPSTLLAVDADTPGAVASFGEHWPGEPTVRTPGSQRGETWVHSNGGHWYFDLTGLELPTSITSATVDGFDLRWGNQYTLAPPSTRIEGPYRAFGDVPDLPPSLLEMVHDLATTRTRARAELGDRFGNDAVSRWSVLTPWGDLLAPDGWLDTSKADQACGCPVWTRPGDAASSRSAIAHEPECASPRYDNIEGHAPLHWFTDNPPAGLTAYTAATGATTMTKLQYVAWVHHSGDEHAAKVALGLAHSADDYAALVQSISPAQGTFPTSGDSSTESQVLDGPNIDITPGQSTSAESLTPIHGESQDSDLASLASQASQADDQADDDQAHDDDQALDKRDPGARYIAEEVPAQLRDKVIDRVTQLGINEFAQAAFEITQTGARVVDEIIGLGDITPEVQAPSVALRSDKLPLLYAGRVNTIFGPSESAKSWFGIACAQSVLANGGEVLVLDVEDDHNVFAHRFATIGVDPAGVHYYRMTMMPSQIMLGKIAAVASRVQLIIIDSFDGFVSLNSSADTNHAGSIRRAFNLMKAWALRNQAAVLVVDHSSEKIEGPANTAMGSSGKKQIMDGIVIRADLERRWAPRKGGETMLMVGKDRHGWAKEHGIFTDGRASWGRIARLVMTPGIKTDKLTLQVPPEYEDDKISDDQLDECERLIFEFLDKQSGDGWASVTATMTAAGDRSGRYGQPEALERLVADGIAETQQVHSRFTQCRLVPLA